MSAMLWVLLSLVVPPPQSPTPDDEWSSLDTELAALEGALAPANSGPVISGWIRSRFAFSSDVDADVSGAGDGGEEDLGGFNLDSVRVVISGQASEAYGYTVSFDAGDPLLDDTGSTGVGLLDAYASIRLSERTTLAFGRFSTTFLWSSGIEDRRMLFLDHGFLGEVWDGRDIGFEFAGAFERINWWASAQNGSDAAAEDLALSARVSFHILGDALHGSEGTLGLGDGEHLTVGLAWFDDTGLDDGTALGADMLLALGRWSSIVEIVDFDEDLSPTPAVNTATGVVIPAAASSAGARTAWGASVGCMLVPERWELAARWQNLDDDADTSVVSAAINRYVAGHDVKWTLQLDTSDSDDEALEADTLAVGLTVGF